MRSGTMAREIINTLKLDESEMAAAMHIAKTTDNKLIADALLAPRERMDTPRNRPRNPMAYFRSVLKRMVREKEIEDGNG